MRNDLIGKFEAKHALHARMLNGLRTCTCASLLSLGLTNTGFACAFHGYTPDPTLVDVLLTTEQAVLARLDPSNPTRYVPTKALLGPKVSDIPIVVDPVTRTALAARPSDTVLLARDGAYGPWVAHDLLDDRFRDVIQHVVQRQSAWSLGAAHERAQHFANLVNDPNPGIRRLALQELDRVPYQTLRALALPKVENLRQELAIRADDLTPIRVLLAGMSQDPNLAAVLAAQLEVALQEELPYLGAYATALIELMGQEALQTILKDHLSDQALSINVRTKLLDALALHHKVAEPPMRRDIARGVADLLRDAPELQEVAQQQFGFRRNWILSRTEPSEASSTEDMR